MVESGIVVELLVDDGVTSPIEEALLSSLLHCALRFEAVLPEGDWTVTLRLTDDERITDIHEQFFADPTPTDVISFPSGDDLADRDGHLGDIVISVDTAASHADEYGHTTAREIAFLALHGLLHLIGYDDATVEERDDMLRRQTTILEAFERERGTSL